MDAKQIVNKIGDKKPYMKRVFHIEEIGLFGSVARGEQTENSIKPRLKDRILNEAKYI